METLEKTFRVGNETIEIWRYGVDDYAVNFDWEASVRGTLMEVMEELFSVYGEEIFEMEL